MLSEAARLQVVLEGVALPAKKRDLVEYARAQDGEAARLLERIPDREYRSLDDVGEALAPVQPRSSREAELPRAESGEPPGGDDYLQPHPTPGAVRPDWPPSNPPQAAIEEQTKMQKEQQQRQQEMLGDEKS